MKISKKKLFTYLITLLVILSYYYLKNNEVNESYSNQLSETNEVSTDLHIYFFDVGQADSILIQNNGKNMLIDAGNNEDGPKLVDYLKTLNISKLDYVIGTHPHEDHIGGLDNIINNFEIENVLLPEAYTTTKTFEDVITSIENHKLNITVPEIGNIFSLAEADFQVIYTGTDNEDLNNSSIVLKMVFGNYSYLFTGDATENIEDKILNSNINIDVLKVAHHGSEYSSTKEFLSKTTPQYAIISVAEENSYGHPSASTIARIKEHTENIYMTSQLGTIKLISDGEKINFEYLETNTNG